MAATTVDVPGILEEWLAQHERRSVLRFIACGSVDDGKSTLMGRLLYEAKAIRDDQLAVLERDSKRIGSRADELDYALLFDGLQSEREQGITIDVAYRFFSTRRRNFIVADAPGHEQYTRNMVTGASTADLAIILVDARKGVLLQTQRHTHLVALLGIRQVLLAVNKMDLVGYSGEIFNRIDATYRAFAHRAGVADIVAIPLSAVRGDNVVAARGTTPWYSGPSLLDVLETVEPMSESPAQAFRMPVQWVNRPNSEFRGYAGTVVAGAVRPGDRIRILPSAQESRVMRIVTADGDLDHARDRQSVTLTLCDDVDVSRGDVIVDADDPLAVADRLEATIVWMDEVPMLPGRSYLIKVATVTTTATIASLDCRVDVDTLDRMPADSLSMNEIGACRLVLGRAIAFAPYAQSRALGGFILIDRLTNRTVGAGRIESALGQAQGVYWQTLDVDCRDRARLKGQRSCVVWFTGISGAGKSTIANLVERRLHALGRHTYLLDGDNVRHGLNKDLGFSVQDRVENVRRVAEVAALMADAGLIVLTAFISPFRAERRMARDLVASGVFVEVFVDTPLSVAEERDTKGLYRKARAGLLRDFTGVDSPYEPPERPDIRIDGAKCTPEVAVETVVADLRRRGFLDAAVAAGARMGPWDDRGAGQ